MAPLGALGETAAELVEIHGQHEHRALVTAGAQRNVLDAFAGTDLSRVRAIRSQLHAIDEALAGLGGDAQQGLARRTSCATRWRRSPPPTSRIPTRRPSCAGRRTASPMPPPTAMPLSGRWS